MNQKSWTITLATVRGIPIRLHLTFLVFLAALSVPGAGSLYDAAVEIFFLCGIFGCIALHELGHALAASWFGIQTRDITIYPFGGIAAITKSPSPKAELVIAIAGPIVNVIIAILIFFTFNYAALFLGPAVPGRLLFANIFLALFNMIPAIPMDGGRVLRALLALGEFKHATLISTRISQVISLGFIGLALWWGRIDLLLVGVVVFSGAVREQIHSQARRAIREHTVADAMIDAAQLTTLSHGTTVDQALGISLRSLQEFFPILYGRELKGVISREDLLQFASSSSENAYVQEAVSRHYPSVSLETPLAQLLDLNHPEYDTPCLVVEDPSGSFAGILLREKIVEFLLIDELRRRMQAPATSDGAHSI